MQKEEIIKKVTDIVAERLNIDGSGKEEYSKKIVTGVSVRHVHLTDSHIEELFGADYKLKPLKELSQPGQYAAAEVVTLVGAKLTALQNIRVLGPPRELSQVELSKTDCIVLGVDAPTRLSGNTSGSAPIVIVGPHGLLNLPEGAIRAERHIHMSPDDAKYYSLLDGSYVDVRVSGRRGLTFNNVIVRVSSSYITEFHVDTDDANTCDLVNGSLVEIVDASCIAPTGKEVPKIIDSERIPPTIPDESNYVSADSVKKDSSSLAKSIVNSFKPKGKILTLADITEIIDKGGKINTKNYTLTPLAIDYIKEKNIKID